MAIAEKATIRKINTRNQITLPPEFLKIYGVHAGDHIAVIEQDGQFIISPLEPRRKEVTARLTALFQDNPGEDDVSEDDAMAMAIREIEAYRKEKSAQTS